MDSTSKAKSWYGSLYGFESSHDVDGFMNKDTAVYLENQVQNVGESMKRLYSSVKNMLPPLKEDRGKSEASFDKEQLSLDDTLENAMASLTFDEKKSQPIEPTRVDACCVVSEDENHTMRNVDVDFVRFASSEGEIFSLPSEKENISLNTSSTSGWEFEDNLSTFEDPKSNEDNIPSSPRVIIADNAHRDYSSISDTPISSDFDGTKRISKEESTLCDNKDGAIGHILTSCSTFPKSSNVFDSSSANYRSPFDTSSTSGLEFEDNLSTFEDPKSNKDNIPSSPQVTIDDNVHRDNSMISDTPISPDFDGNKRISKEESTLCDNKDGAIGHILTSCSTFPKSSNILNSSSANYTHLESIQSSVVNLNDCSYDPFTSSSATLYHRTKASGSPPVIPIESSKDQIDADDDVMETIDLSSDAKPDRRPAVADSNSSDVASYRKKNFSYYKKLIKNALTSHTRLAKEYEHLPILHGDINTELCSSDPHSLPISTRTQSSTENEWELL